MIKDTNRRNFIKILGAGTLSLTLPNYSLDKDNKEKIVAREFHNLANPDYYNVSYNEIEWKNAFEGLEFSRTNIYKDKKLVDIIATVKINPEKNKIRVFNNYSLDNTEVHNIEEWQRNTDALAIINSSQYMGKPWGCPCALVICDGKQKGPKFNKTARGMFLAEPKEELKDKLPLIDMLDFEYDEFDFKTTKYTQGVQHWPILLDRIGKVKLKSSLWQANRTVVAKTNNDEMLFMTTEGGYFTLYNLGQFLRDSNKRLDKGFNIHTAMNMDGGYEASMSVETPKLSYVTYGEFETRGPNIDLTVHGTKQATPGAIGVFPRN